ncbi:MAG: SRPBCC family protein [Flavobacteriales bacterium]|nr:SRPBCC family protein [Flavobacteriales bacterium]
MLLYILLGLASILVILLIAAAMKPNTVHYERITVVNAPPEKILPHIADLHRWMAWSPWDKLDPNMKRDHSGAQSGVGAKYGWVGNNKAGEGTMEVLEAGNSGVKIDPRFVRPFKSDCITHFHFTPQGNATKVRWTMDGPNLFMGKLFGLFMNMDKMIGKDFETGLAGLKMEVERSK